MVNNRQGRPKAGLELERSVGTSGCQTRRESPPAQAGILCETSYSKTGLLGNEGTQCTTAGQRQATMTPWLASPVSLLPKGTTLLFLPNLVK